MPKDAPKDEKKPNVTGPVKPLNADARADVQAKWDSMNPEPKPEADTKEAPEGDDPQNPPPADGKKDGDTDGPSDKGPTDDTDKVEDGKDGKTVPHQALHEERGLHKETKSQLKDAQEQVRLLLADLKKVHDEKAAGGTKDEPKDDGLSELEGLDPKAAEIIRRQQKQLDELIADRGNRAKDDKDAALRAEVAKAEKMVADTATSLDKEGFVGFSRFKHLVREELVKVAESNPDEAKKLDNPQGWAKLYREKVYPEISSMFVKKAKGDKLKEKEDNKVGADLIDGKGKGEDPNEKKKDDEWEFGDYLKMREQSKIV